MDCLDQVGGTALGTGLIVIGEDLTVLGGGEDSEGADLKEVLMDPVILMGIGEALMEEEGEGEEVGMVQGDLGGTPGVGGGVGEY